MNRILIFVFLLLTGCGPSQQFVAVPADIDMEAVPKDSVMMTAERFRFVPDAIHVRKGTLVILRIKAIDATHGFQLGDFGIDETIRENETKTVEFYASTKGVYGFRCSHFCGIGHLGMTGKLVVE